MYKLEFAYSKRGMMIYITKLLKKHHKSKSPAENNLRLQVNIV